MLVLTQGTTQDGGMWFEVERSDEKRDLLFAHNLRPDLIGTIYFTARDNVLNLRYAGIVKEMSAIFALMQWVDGDGPFPVDIAVELG